MRKKLVRENYGGEVMEYLPLGKYVVSATGVCGGRPTFKYTRIEVAGVLEYILAGNSVEQLLTGYEGRVKREALLEAARLAGRALEQQAAAEGKALARPVRLRAKAQ